MLSARRTEELERVKKQCLCECGKWRQLSGFNPFTAATCKISRLKSAHAYMPANSIFSGPTCNKSTFNTVCFYRNLFTCLSKKKKRLKDFRFCSFIDCLK